MKFVIAAVVLLAVAMGVQSSIIAGVPGLGLGINGLGINGLGLGLGVNTLGLGINGLGLGVAVGVPGQSLSQGPAWLGAPAAVNIAGAGLVGHGATYVAKTRGAIHTAPLAGHINSAASINVAPAPVFMFLSLLINITLYAVPIIFIQTFLGQFSSSGIISVFRIAPLFKGMGYVGLVMNLVSLAYYGVFAGVPLLFFIHSLQVTLPWSCEGTKDWMPANESHYAINHCEIDFNDVENSTYIHIHIPSAEFFGHLVRNQFSFHLFGCVLAVWAVVAFILYNTTERIGQILRYSGIVLLILLAIVFTRMLLMPFAMEGLANEYTFQKSNVHWHIWFIMVPMLTFASFGPGWGTTLSMASYNKFKTNITMYSWLIAVTQIGVLLMAAMMCMFAEYHLTRNHPNFIAPSFNLLLGTFLTIPSSLATMDYPHLWTWIFFAVLVIGSINLVVVQMFTVLTAVFDEFEQLRCFRKEIIFGTATILALISTYFCSENGLRHIETVSEFGISGQALMSLLLLIVVLWVYGRERFQRDVAFMTGKVLATWKVLTMRFVTPLFVSLTLFISVVLSLFDGGNISNIQYICIVLAILPWFALPGYCVFRLMQTQGSIGLRFNRCTKPTDWYPVDPEDRQRYEESTDYIETSLPLTTIVY